MLFIIKTFIYEKHTNINIKNIKKYNSTSMMQNNTAADCVNTTAASSNWSFSLSTGGRCVVCHGLCEGKLSNVKPLQHRVALRQWKVFLSPMFSTCFFIYFFMIATN